MTVLRLIAPAKINWTIEVLRIRPDGYHEVRSVLQTIDLHDTVTLTDAVGIELVLTGDAGALADEPPDQNLAYRAAAALQRHIGTTPGVRIELAKRIPVAAGLGGGSSDAAAVLRGCNRLWHADRPDAELARIAAEIGSDPPFFVTGGTATVSGRGEHVEPLDDAIAPAMLLATPPPAERGAKTALMFAALTPEHFTEGEATIGLRDVVAAGRAVNDAELANVFERVLTRMQPETEKVMDALRAQGTSPHLAGAGPSFFLLLDDAADHAALARRVRDLGFEPHFVRTLSRIDALRLEEL